MIDAKQFPKRVHDLAERDSMRRLFGCELHKYKLGRRLTSFELDALESAYAIEIPAEYRAFLATVGNGGAGPGYGLVPLSPPVVSKPRSNRKMAVTLTDEDGQTTYKAELDDVASIYDPNGLSNTATAKEPFPLKTPYRSITDEMWSVQIPNWDDRLRSEHQRNKSEFKKISFGHGVFRIADYGSGIYAVLVINGNFRGQVWLTDPHMGDYVPASMRTDLHDSTIKTENAYRLHSNSFSFNDWYNHWLDSAFRELDREYANVR